MSQGRSRCRGARWHRAWLAQAAGTAAHAKQHAQFWQSGRHVHSAGRQRCSVQQHVQPFCLTSSVAQNNLADRMPWPICSCAMRCCRPIPSSGRAGEQVGYMPCRLRGPHNRQTQVFLQGEWLGAASRRPHEPCNIHADIVDRLQKPSAQYMGGIC